MNARRDKRDRNPNSFRGRGFEPLEARALLTIAIAPIPAATVPALKTILIPLHGTDSTGSAINYEVDASNPDLSAWVRTGSTFLKLSVANQGDMVFELFDDVAPGAVARIVQLVDAHFYDGMSFTSVKNGIIQAGDTPASPGTAPNEFDAGTIFTGSGQLALSNSGPNTDGGRFFITAGPQRSRDFVDTIFGQLVSGQSVLNAINQAPIDASGRPTTPLTITSASIVADNADAVLVVSAPDGRGTSRIDVTASNEAGDLAKTSFNVSFAPDTVNDRPYLDRIDDQTIIAGTDFNAWVGATDLEGDPIDVTAVQTDGKNSAKIDITDGSLTVTPNPGFTGSIPIRVTATQQGSPDKTAVRTFVLTVVPLTINVDAPARTTVAGSDSTLTYATFTASPQGWVGDYSATVNFGDGATADATLVPHAGGGYDVVATHQYASAGDYATTIVVNGPGGNSQTAKSTVKALAADAVPLKVDVTTTSNDTLNQSTLTYTIKVTNQGTEALSGLNLTGLLSGGLTYASASIKPSSADGPNLVIPLGNLAAGASLTLTIDAKANDFGTVSAQFQASNGNASSVPRTDMRFVSFPIPLNPPPINSTGGGGVPAPPGGKSLSWVKAPKGVNAHAITLTSRAFSQIIGGRFKGWNGLSAIMGRFNHTGNVLKLKNDLAKLARHVPYGKTKLLATWQKTVDDAGLGRSKRDAKGLVQAQLRQNLVNYLNAHVGVDINVVKSKARHSSDRLLTFNGRL